MDDSQDLLEDLGMSISPEAMVGGPLAWVKDGDIVEISLSKRSLNLESLSGN